MKYKVLQLILISALCVANIFAQSNDSLVLYKDDVRIIEEPTAGGFFLYVKKKEGIGSVLLTESAETPNRDLNTYALRTKNYNGINGNEKRVLNGRFIQPRQGYFIIDSTPEPDLEFGSAFVLFLPYKIQFGYENTRNGIIELDLRQDGLYLSIRTFAEPYANYSGSYVDNSFYLERIENTPVADPNAVPTVPNLGIGADNLVANTLEAPNNEADFSDIPPALAPDLPSLSVPIANVQDTEPIVVDAPELPDTTTPAPTATSATGAPATSESLAGLLNTVSADKYSPATISSFIDIAEKTNSRAYYVENKNDIVDKIGSILEEVPKDKSTDVVILIDTTRSMWDDLAVLKSRLVPTISKIMRGAVYRIGLVLYRDKDEEYVTRAIDFNDQLSVIQRQINGLQAGGGGDWPEAVYEALDEAINEFVWISENRIVFIIGDAPPHEPPDTDVNLEQLYQVTAAQRITVYPLIVPRRD